MTDKIKLGTSDEGEVSLDINQLVDSRMLIEGNSGSGKSYLLRLLCENAAEHVPVIILDCEGEFASLREKIDAILIGPEGDVPTDIRSAALLARKLVELRVSAIIDLYELKVHVRREYVRLFLDALIALPRSLWHPTLIILDEAHKFAPERGQGDAISTQSVIDLMSLGRKRGFAGVLATQRFSKIHNDAIAETNNVFIGRTWQDADQKRAGEYLGLAAADRRMLRDLKPGEFYAFGPALSIGGIIKFKGGKAATSHPKPGERHTIKPPKASDAITHIVSQIEDLPEVAEQERQDIATLQQKNRELERQLKQRPVEKGEPVVQTVEVFPPKVGVMILSRLEGLGDALTGIVHDVNQLHGRIADIGDIVNTQVQSEPKPKAFASIGSHPVDVVRHDPAHHQATVRKMPDNASPNNTFAFNGSLPEGEMKCLIAIAQHSNGDHGATREQVTILSGYKRSTRDAYIQRLGAKGFVEVRSGEVWATVEGIAALGSNFEPLPTGSDLRQYWLQRLPEGEAKVLAAVINEHPNFVSRDAISSLTDYKRSTRDAYIQRLGVRKLVTTSSMGVKASDHLF